MRGVFCGLYCLSILQFNRYGFMSYVFEKVLESVGFEPFYDERILFAKTLARMSVRAESHKLTAKFFVSQQNLGRWQEVKPRAFALGIYLESFALSDNGLEYIVDNIGEVLVIEGFVLVYALADDVADMTYAVVMVRAI